MIKNAKGLVSSDPETGVTVNVMPAVLACRQIPGADSFGITMAIKQQVGSVMSEKYFQGSIRFCNPGFLLSIRGIQHACAAIPVFHSHCQQRAAGIDDQAVSETTKLNGPFRLFEMLLRQLQLLVCDDHESEVRSQQIAKIIRLVVTPGVIEGKISRKFFQQVGSAEHVIGVQPVECWLADQTLDDILSLAWQALFKAMQEH